MPDLSQSLQGRDLGHLRIIAQLWDLDFDAPDARVGLQRLVPLLLGRTQVEVVVADLPLEARRALDDLLMNEGRLPWSLFTRRYGLVREMGIARRDRERPYGKSASAAEALWYRGLVGRAFFDTSSGPEEFAYIPDDLLPLLPAPSEGQSKLLGRPATPTERAHPLLASDRILDDATTLLAALRLGIEPLPGFLTTPIPLLPILSAAGLLDEKNIPLPEPTRAFLEAPRGEALAFLTHAWLHSSINDLRQTPGLRCDGEWQNDPLRARRAVLGFLAAVAGDRWWSLAAFIADIRRHHPDFQRPAGDYDSWYIRDDHSGEFLRGFEHWDRVDGAYLRYVISGPMYALGILDLAAAEAGGIPTAFRYSPWAAALLRGEPPQGLPLEDALLKVSSDACIFVPRLAPRAIRYQIARFAEWEMPQGDRFRYRITPSSLMRARQQGLTVSHLLILLRRYAENVSPSLTKALARWEGHGTEAVLEQATIIRVASPEIMQALRASRAARFLGDPLGPTAIIVKQGACEKVLAVLAEMGYLGEIRSE